MVKYYAFNQSEFKWFDTKDDLAEFLGCTVKWLEERLQHKIPQSQGYFIGKAGVNDY
jgi:hypothetical protein